QTSVLSRSEVPPLPSRASQIVWGELSEPATFRSFPSAKYATKRPSGDQNGKTEPATLFGVSTRARESSLSSGRIISSGPRAENTMAASCAPSGEIASVGDRRVVPPSEGKSTSNAILAPSGTRRY